MFVQHRVVSFQSAVIVTLAATVLSAQSPPTPQLMGRGGAEVTVGTVVFQGPSSGLDASDVAALVRGGSEGYLDCYMPVLPAMPTLGGEIQLEVTLGRNGRPTVVTPTLLPNAADVSQCVARVVHGMVFPRAPQRQPVHFRVGVTLHPPVAQRSTAEPPNAASPNHIVVPGLPGSVIRQTLHTYHSAVDHCVDRATQSEPNLSGQIVVHFTVAADGHVAEATAVNPAPELSGLAGCITSAALTWTFPAPSNGQPVSFDHPFNFSPVNN